MQHILYTRDHLDNLVNLDSLVLMDNLDYLDLLDYKVLREKLDHK